MKVSIVTPTLNSGRFLPETLRSLQCSSAEIPLEHIIVDGGSRDSTLEIAHSDNKEARRIFIEPSLNQYEAIQFGFEQATGDIFAWLNSDDIYAPWTLGLVGRIFKDFPDIDWITGMPGFIDAAGFPILLSDRVSVYPRSWIRNGWYRRDGLGYLMQENMFWRREVWERSGGFDAAYPYAGDFDLWTRFAQETSLISVGVPLAFFRKHGANRSANGTHYADEVAKRCETLPSLPSLFRLAGGRTAARNLLRLAMRAKGERIVRRFGDGAFCRKSGWGPVGRYSLASLLAQRRS